MGRYSQVYNPYEVDDVIPPTFDNLWGWARNQHYDPYLPTVALTIAAMVGFVTAFVVVRLLVFSFLKRKAPPLIVISLPRFLKRIRLLRLGFGWLDVSIKFSIGRRTDKTKDGDKSSSRS